jgi:hypothetical protein
VKEQVEAERKEERTIAAWNLSQPHSSMQKPPVLSSTVLITDQFAQIILQ